MSAMKWFQFLSGCCLALLFTIQSTPGLAQESATSEPLPLQFARRDLTRWTTQVEVSVKTVVERQAALDAASKAVADAKAAQQAADKAVVDAAAAITAAELAKVAAEKALADAVEKKKVADAAKAAADAKVPVAEQAVKPATDAKAAAENAAALVQQQLKIAQERVAAIEKGPITPVPATTRLLNTLTHDRPVMACRFDSLGNSLFVGAQDNSFHRWDIFAGPMLHQPGHGSWVGAIQLLPKLNQAVTGGHEGKLTWWGDLDSTPKVVRTVDAHKGYLRAIAVSPDGTLVATGGNDNMVRVWSAADGSLVKELPGHERHVYNVAFHPSGKFLISGDLVGVLKQWEVGPWTLIRDLDAKVLWKFDAGFQADVGGIRAIDFSPDGKLLAVGGITEVSNAFAGVGVPAVVLFDFEAGKQLRVMKPKDNFQGSVYSLRFHPTEPFIVAAGGGNGASLWFWKYDEEKSFADVKLPGVAYDMTLHPDGLRLAVAMFDKTLRIYDMGPKIEPPPAPAAK
ncbi:MAG: WD40 repeat domain-containing protein [Planctomycetota bacterium]|nr:WD40 repeat domain-containing protein [Planctomycetota bacterium]